MTVMLIVHKNAPLYLRTQLHGLGRAETDEAYRKNLRIIMAVLFAHWSDTNPDLTGIRGNLFDVITNESFYQEGFNKTSDKRLWFCSYVGFEKTTSEWAKEHAPSCRGYICMRVFVTDEFSNELESHTIIIYY